MRVGLRWIDMDIKYKYIVRWGEKEVRKGEERERETEREMRSNT